MKNKNRNKYLMKNTLIFSIGNFGTKIIHFLLVPLYTNILSTSEYGALDLMTVLSMVIMPIITLNIAEAVMRFSMDKDSDKNDIVNIATLVFLFSVVLALFSIPILNTIGYISDYSFLLFLYIITLSSSTITMCYIRGNEKLLSYAIISILQTIIIAGLNILLLVKFNLGIKGYILSYIIAYLITTILCILKGNTNKIHIKFKINKNLFKNMLKYSLLLIPNSLMWWIMNSLDRIMVTNMIGISENGIYAVSYKIPTILITLTTIFNQAWMFSAVKEKDSDDKDAYTNSIFNSLAVSVISVTCFLIYILKPLLSIYVGKEFYSAWLYTPPLLIGTIFLTLGTFLSNEYTAHKDSMGFLKSSFIGAFVNLLLNFVLIPFIGIFGAALATCISYLTVFIFRYFDTKKYVKIELFSIKRIISLLIVLILSLLIYIDNLYIYIPLTILLILLIIINNNFWKGILKNIVKIVKRRKKDE